MARKLTEQEQGTLTHIWSGLHENGRSQQAAELARRKFVSLPTQEFDATQPDIYYTELARQVVVTGTAAARKEKNTVRAFPLLLHSAETIVQSYPIAHTAGEAKKRAAFWNASGAENNDFPAGQTLRDTLHTLRALEMMFESDAYEDLKEEILLAMAEVSHRYPQDRFALIGQIEEAELDEAQEAFKTFTERFGPAKKLRPPATEMPLREEIVLQIPVTQLITVSSRLIGRELRGRKLIAAHHHRQELLADVALYEEEMKRKLASPYTSAEEKEALASELQRLPALLKKEQFAGVFRPFLDGVRKNQWRSQMSQNPGAYAVHLLRPLQTLSHVGLSANQALQLSHENR